MENSSSKITQRLIFTAFVATAIVFFNAVISFSVVFFPSEVKNLFIAENPKIDFYQYFLVFLFGFMSNAIFYNVKTDLRLKIAISAFLFTLGSVAAYFHTNLTVFYLSRSLIGFGSGICSSVIPCYLSIISPERTKGLFSSLYCIGLVSGLLADNLLNTIITDNYQLIMLISAICLCILMVLQPLCIPLKLVSSGESFLELVLNPKARKSLFLVAIFHTVQNLCGINHITYYAKKVYGENHCWHQSATLVIGLVMTIATGYLLCSWARKPLIMVSSAVMMGCCIALYYEVYNCFFGYLFIIGFNLGMGNIPYVIMEEVFPPKYVGVGALFATSWNWAGSIISTVIYSDTDSAEETKIPEKETAFLIYAGICGVFIAMIGLFFKETINQKPALQ